MRVLVEIGVGHRVGELRAISIGVCAGVSVSVAVKIGNRAVRIVRIGHHRHAVGLFAVIVFASVGGVDGADGFGFGVAVVVKQPSTTDRCQSHAGR